MRPKSMVLVMIALGCGLVAAFAAFQVVGSQNGGPAAVETVKVFVAMNEIDIDEEFDSSNVQLEEWPKDRVPEDAIGKLEDLENKFAAQRLYKGEIIIAKKVIDPEARIGKAIMIPDGYRVCTVKVAVDTAHNGLLNPGDRVDILVFLRKTSDVPITGIRSVLKDVRVFAVNAETERAYDKEGNKINAKTISFLVKPDQAGKLMLASQLGVLQLSLRRPDEVGSGRESADISLDSILRGSADLADDRQPKAETELPIETPVATVEPTPTKPAVRHAMEIIYPDGAQRHVWYKAGQLPVLDAANSTLPDAADGSGDASISDLDDLKGDDSDGDLPDFDDENDFGGEDPSQRSEDRGDDEDSF